MGLNVGGSSKECKWGRMVWKGIEGNKEGTHILHGTFLSNWIPSHIHHLWLSLLFHQIPLDNHVWATEKVSVCLFKDEDGWSNYGPSGNNTAVGQ